MRGRRERQERRRRLGGVGLRWRITIAFLGGVFAVSALVAGTTYLLADRYLFHQRVDDSIQQAYGNVKLATGHLSRTEGETNLDEMVAVWETRGAFDALVMEGGQWSSSSPLSVTPRSIPVGLADAVGQGDVGWALREAEERELVFGSPIPGSEITAFFFYPLEDLKQTLTILRNVLVGVSAGAVALAILAGTRVSGRVVDPVRRASRAARRVAEGLLETRLPAGGGDELGVLAESFNEMAAALEEQIARERRFVGDVSHELRTPLTTLRTSAEYLLRRGEELPSSMRRAAELLAADLEHLLRLVDDLLELSRVEAGRVQMSWEPLSLADLAREVIARRSRTARATIRLEVDGPPETVSTHADKKRLERVVGNLVENALVHGGGQDVVVRVGSRDGSLYLSVQDRGPGVPAEVSDRIFERFFKADPARHRGDGGGSGLGLAIARENAHLHGGELLYEGGSDGARFTLRLPRRDHGEEA